MVLLDPYDIRRWVEEAIKLNAMYSGLGYDEREAMRLTVEEMQDAFTKMRLAITAE